MRKSIDFLQLTTKLPYPPSVKGKLSTIHATLIDQFLSVFTGKHTEKMKVIQAINCVTYMYISSDSMPFSWDETDPYHTYRMVDDDELEDFLSDKGLYLTTKDIDWSGVQELTSDSDLDRDVSVSIEPIVSNVTVPEEPTPIRDAMVNPVQTAAISTPKVSVQQAQQHPFSIMAPTDKSDLYIQPPVVPRFDYAHPWKSGILDDTPYVIYPSYPIIPTKQNEISVTTDVNKMSASDLKRLYPNCMIRTRAACMYEPTGELLLDQKLGLILPIEGYTKQQLIDNLVKYPHIFRLMKHVGDSVDSFYSTIEIDGELHKISEVWNTLPEANLIPYTKEFVKEYVVRRYLLERDIKKIDHKYKLYGTLDPFLTLFTSQTDYINMGYDDIIQMARDCVTARVNYKISRNPVLRRLADV